VHLHFAILNGRVWPKSVDEDSEYRRFFDLVKKTGYRGGLSIEGKGTFDEDAAASSRSSKNWLEINLKVLFFKPWLRGG